ncbi:MAG: mechanosensitive ion channel family protein [Bifidobacteriaceae bacterium]|jgi:small conductance mechanosensitive channel|nr:mechanosensitive ion channel family protein [Bifidobacteriaceae bacterium]
MTFLTTPAFAESWPGWAQFLIGAPLRIVIILAAAWLVLVVSHAVIRRVTARIAKRPGRMPAGGRAVLGDPTVPPVPPEHSAARRESRFLTLGSVLRSAATVTVWVLAICLVLETLGVNPGLIITSVGVAGLGLGLGAQGLVKDLLAGVLILTEDQYGLGDVIDAGPATGVVEAMSLRITTLRDENGVTWYIPNGSVTRIGNKSH